MSLCSTLWHDFWHPRVMKGLPGVGLREPQASADVHCIWSALFAPSPRLRVRVAAGLTRLLGSRNSRFVGVHLRLGGGLVGERKRDVGDNVQLRRANGGGDALLAQRAAQACAMQLRRDNLSSPAALSERTPVLLVTDDAALRLSAARGQLAGVVAPRRPAVHSSLGSPSEEEQFAMWEELGMLAASTCLVKSFSGFSNLAHWWGGQSCVVTVDECIQRLQNDSAGQLLRLRA